MILLANGCSNTYGAGLVDNQRLNFPDSFEEADQQRQQESWPGQLGPRLGAEYVVNLGASCGSNQRIIRTCLEWCLNQSPETLRKTVAVIQWTHSMRYEYYVPKKSRINWKYSVHKTEYYGGEQSTDPDPRRWGKIKVGAHTGVELEPTSIGGRDLVDIGQTRYLLWTPEEGMYKDIESYSALANIFQTFGVRYFYWHLLGYNLSPRLEDWSNQTFSWVDPTNPSARFWEYDRLPCSHPSAQGHRTIAEKIAELIKIRL